MALRIGVLSTARIAPAAIIEPARLVEGVQVTAVAARSLSDAAEFAATHGIANVLPSYEALCASDLVDAVYIATPSALHRKWTLCALSNGKHVLCEKPLGANAADAATMVAAGQAADRVMMEAFHWRFHPMAQRITELCAELGSIESATARFDIGVIPTSDIRFDLGLGGGALMDLGVYPLQWVRHVFGTEPVVISANAVQAPEGIDIVMNASLAFPTPLGTASAEISCSMEFGVAFEADLTVRGSLGSLHVRNPLAPQLGNKLTLTTAAGERSEVAPTSTTYEWQLRAFLAAVNDAVPLPTGGTDSIATMQAVDAIYRAASMQPRPSA